MDFYPSIIIKNLSLVCTLAAAPPFRASKAFQISYPMPKETQPTEQNQLARKTKTRKGPSITKDGAWRGPTINSAYSGRTLHRVGIYIPIPFDLFRRTSSRQFDIDASVEVSIANGVVLFLRASKRTEFSHFVKLGVDDSKRCRLFD